MTYMLKEIYEQPRVMAECLKNNREIIREIVGILRTNEVESVLIAARGTSDHAAVFGKYVIEILLGIPVTLAAPSVFTMYQKSLKLKNTLVIGISQSGKAADVLEVLKSANLQGSLTVSITNDPDSPLAQEAKYHLYCSAGLEKSVAATKTFISQISLMALLAVEWSGNMEIRTALLEVPGHMTRFLEGIDGMEEQVQRYRYMNECFVLARGVNYAIALESALKIQETSYVRAKAYATSDFYHGPYAMIDKGMPVLVFAPQGPSLKDVKEMIQKLRKNEAELIIISNDRKTLEMGYCAFEIPETDSDILSPFYNVLVAQLFALNLSLIKGLNPDTPRSLNKVTITV